MAIPAGMVSAMRRVMISLLLAAAVLRAQEPDGPADRREVSAFLDGVMGAQQRAHNFAGAVAVVVKDDSVLFAKGYGYSDHAARKPVDPGRTLFRVASNSKMFVWTAVMQLVEQGKLDLQTDVNRYLRGVRIPEAFAQPVTLEHLMTHTAGFEDRAVGLFSKTADRMGPLADVIRTGMPARVFPPGKVTAYSNFGSALAALIVEQVSGLPFEQYLNQRILSPLGMEHATLAQPLPPALAPDMSKGYRWAGGRLVEQPFEYVPLAPCGGMSVAGEDMGRFMIAQLNDGAHLLRAETARSMRERLISYAGGGPGMLHGFMGLENNGIKAFGHGGDTVWFHSMTVMIPERRIGFFVAYNTDQGAAARSAFVRVFFDHYFPAPLPREGPPPKERRAQLNRFAGTYLVARSSQSDYSKLGQLMSAVMARVNEDGYLVVGPNRWRQVEPLLFAQVDGTGRLAFREDARGNILDACGSPTCTSVLLKQPWWRSASLEMTVADACLAVLLMAVVGIPIAAAVQRRQPKPPGSKFTRLLAWWVSALFLAGVAILLPKVTATADEVVFGTPLAVRIAVTLWTSAAALAMVLLVYTILSWRRRWWRLPGRVSITLVGLAAIGSALWLYHWNLIGWRY
jgi:CubicO group peptidase (beta-lactamase class C family)